MVEDFLRRQDGVITLAQARRSGLTEWSVRRRVQSGQWRRCGRGVYFADDRPFTTAARIRAAVWSHGEAATASGLAAAWWLELTKTDPSVIEVTVPRSSHSRSARGIKLRRRDLTDAEVIEYRRLRITAPALTVIEASIARGGGPEIMDTALQRGMSLDDLQHAYEQNRWRPGATAVRELLAAAASGARSEAERLLVELFESNGITGWFANYPAGGYSIDFAFPAEMLAIELDGWAFHSDFDAFQNDRKRQNKLILLGWQVLRFTWLDLVQHPDRVLAQVTAARSR
jgi:very-short-patch-repair endonuclease